MSIERLLLPRLVAVISLYMIQPGPQTLRVKSPSHKNTFPYHSFSEAKCVQSNSRTLRVGV